MRHIRSKLGLSQTAFARLLGVSPESYRPWDSGRRRPQREWMDKARSLLAVHDPARVLSMVQLADVLGVHPRTLRDAARAGRLEVTYTNHVAFGHPVPRATLAAGRIFMEQHYKKAYSRYAVKPDRPYRPTLPPDFHQRITEARQCLGISQQAFARRVGAASKAVVYQWESRKRRPSALLWLRILRVIRNASRLKRNNAAPADSARA